ncbi:zinc ribbon domain-containing protein [Roseibium porphyridii]|uniref:Zinc ribbon domain-containing protein n=1 Tax=Roseibium porphyridii TaxID=2866279 RepID=A0ABY8F3M3_9HYPH|nr:MULTISPECIES: zinc ribbon domain-containing protein [Stappiaceae]WFE88637.1 zinc ribbon domain-containing protein [Roseibium sp. KMA01]
MPVYDYLCAQCGPITALRPMSAHSEPIECPVCKQEAPRAFLQAPNMSTLSTSDRTAHQRNETSRHSPVHSTKSDREDGAKERRKRHPAGCSCCSSSKNSFRSSAVYKADGSKTFPSKRPWMISH